MFLGDQLKIIVQLMLRRNPFIVPFSWQQTIYKKFLPFRITEQVAEITMLHTSAASYTSTLAHKWP